MHGGGLHNTKKVPWLRRQARGGITLSSCTSRGFPLQCSITSSCIAAVVAFLSFLHTFSELVRELVLYIKLVLKVEIEGLQEACSVSIERIT